MTSKGKPTTIYTPIGLMENYRSVCKTKLGIKAGPRIVELIRKDLAALLGKPVVDETDDINSLQARLEGLTRRRDDLIKLLKVHKSFDNLYDFLVEKCGFYPEPPEKARAAVRAFIKEFRDGNIDTADPADVQLFLGLVDVAIERKKVLNRLADLRIKRYSDDPEDTQERTDLTSENDGNIQNSLEESTEETERES